MQIEPQLEQTIIELCTRDCKSYKPGVVLEHIQRALNSLKKSANKEIYVGGSFIEYGAERGSDEEYDRYISFADCYLIDLTMSQEQGYTADPNEEDLLVDKVLCLAQENYKTGSIVSLLEDITKWEPLLVQTKWGGANRWYKAKYSDQLQALGLPTMLPLELEGDGYYSPGHTADIISALDRLVAVALVVEREPITHSEYRDVALLTQEPWTTFKDEDLLYGPLHKGRQALRDAIEGKLYVPCDFFALPVRLRMDTIIEADGLPQSPSEPEQYLMGLAGCYFLSETGHINYLLAGPINTKHSIMALLKDLRHWSHIGRGIWKCPPILKPLLERLRLPTELGLGPQYNQDSPKDVLGLMDLLLVGAENYVQLHLDRQRGV